MKIVANKNNKRFIALMGSWAKRMRAFSRVATYTTAKYALDMLRTRIPRGRGTKAYRESLQLVEVAAKINHPTFAIVSKSKQKRGVDRASGNHYIIYIRPRRKLAPVPAAIRVLMAYNPWTTETLPFKPKDSEAVVEYQPVTNTRMRAVTKEREGDRSQWHLKLTQLGLRLGSSAQRSDTTVPNITQDGVQLEFGRGRKPAVPHWRPILRGIDRKGVFAILKLRFSGRRYLEQIFTNPKEPKMKLPRLQKITSEQALRFDQFSARLLGKAGR